jgi:hypothetical protein
MWLLCLSNIHQLWRHVTYFQELATPKRTGFLRGKCRRMAWATRLSTPGQLGSRNAIFACTNLLGGNRHNNHRMIVHSTRSGSRNKSRLRSQRTLPRHGCRKVSRHRCRSLHARFDRIGSSERGISRSGLRRFSQLLQVNKQFPHAFARLFVFANLIGSVPAQRTHF